MDRPFRDTSSPPTAGSETAAFLRHLGILERLFAAPSREFTIRELSLESGVPYATTWRTVRDLLAFGVLREKRVGASRVVALNPTSPLLPDLKRLSSVRLQPHRSAALHFARLVSRVPGVVRVVLFGSVSRGTSGPESDVDVAVVIDRRTEETVDRIFRVAGKAQDETGFAIAPIVLGQNEIETRSRLARDVRSGEILYDRP